MSCDIADHGQAITIVSPHLVVEVLSPSTERADHTKKLPAYQACSAIQEIVFIRQDMQFVEVYRRSKTGTRWDVQYYHAGETIALESLDIAIPVASLYEGLTIPKEEGD
ncbi:MAG: Uma2 family endonuclease [Ktedonobacteraceae bacterium]|nr:Uma2 family endonuclease [Ktedonobacteraceae bacterium]